MGDLLSFFKTGFSFSVMLQTLGDSSNTLQIPLAFTSDIFRILLGDLQNLASISKDHLPQRGRSSHFERAGFGWQSNQPDQEGLTAMQHKMCGSVNL